jgi:hypothetical protein
VGAGIWSLFLDIFCGANAAIKLQPVGIEEVVVAEPVEGAKSGN